MEIIIDPKILLRWSNLSTCARSMISGQGEMSGGLSCSLVVAWPEPWKILEAMIVSILPWFNFWMIWGCTDFMTPIYYIFYILYYIYRSIEAIKHGDLFQSEASNCQRLVSKSDFFDDLMTAQNMNMKRCLFTPIAGKGIQEAIVILADRLGHLRRMAWTEKRRSVCCYCLAIQLWKMDDNCQFTDELYNINLPWFTYQTWWFSIAMLHSQRVSSKLAR